MLTRVVDAVAPGGGGGGVARAGLSRGGGGAPAASWPHGKDNVAPRAPVVKRAVNPAAGAKPPAKRRCSVPQARPERPIVPVVLG